MNNFNANIHKRHSTRLNGYDYSREGLYFITICCVNKTHFLGEIIDGKMILNEIGHIIYNEWLNTMHIRPNIRLHHFVVMPNHFHAIVEILFKANIDNTMDKFKSPSQTIGAIIRGFKSSTTKQINKLLNENNGKLPFLINGLIFSFNKTIWQRNYHDHIIRNEQSYLYIAEYIENNPLQWELDCFYSK